MEDTSEIIIQIDGKIGDENISPSNFGIVQLKELLGYLEDLTQSDKQDDIHPVSLVSIEEGSVKNIFRASSVIVAQIAVILNLLSTSPSLDNFRSNETKALEGLRQFTIKHNYKLRLSAPEYNGSFSITPETEFKHSDEVPVDVEKYYYGKIVDAGGKSNANIHIDTGKGVLVVNADKEYISNIKGNPLYKDFYVRVKAKQNLRTGEIEKNTLKLIEIIEYDPQYDEGYIKSKIEAATPIWNNVDADKYVRNIREGVYGG